MKRPRKRYYSHNANDSAFMVIGGDDGVSDGVLSFARETDEVEYTRLSAEAQKREAANRRDKRRPSPEKVEQIRTLRANLVPIAEIAEIVGVTGTTVSNYTRDMGVKIENRTRGGRSISPEQVARIRALRAQGHSRISIAEECDVSVDTVTKYTRDKSKARKGPRVTPVMIEGMRKMRQSNSAARVAKHYSVSVQTVYRYAKLGNRYATDSEREADIVARRPYETLETIGAAHEITRERVRQIIAAYEKRTGETVDKFKRPKAERVLSRSLSPVQKMMERATLNPETGCWHWHGSALVRKGVAYPLFEGIRRVTGENFVRRAAYRLWRGEIPHKHYVVPQCGDNLCINPFHLEAVTVGERIRQSDSWDHERGTWKHAPPSFTSRKAESNPQ